MGLLSNMALNRDILRVRSVIQHPEADYRSRGQENERASEHQYPPSELLISEWG